MTHTLRHRLAALVLAGAVFTACGGSDDDAQDDAAGGTTTTDAAGDTTTTADAGADPSGGIGGLNLFVINWNAKNTVGRNTVQNWVDTPLDKDAIVQAGDVFAARLNDGAVLAGRVEGDEVTSVLVGVDPNHPSAASVVQTGLLRHVAEDADLAEVVTTYRDTALGPIGGSAFLVAGEDDALVISVVEAANTSGRQVLVSMSDLTDEAAARARADQDRAEALALLG